MAGSLAERWVLGLRGGRGSIALTPVHPIGCPLASLNSVSAGGRLTSISVWGCPAGLGPVTVRGSLSGLRAIDRSLAHRRAVGRYLGRGGAVAIRARCPWRHRATAVGGISRPQRVESGVARLARGNGALRIACYSVLRPIGPGVVRHIVDVLACPTVENDVDDACRQKNDRDNHDENEGLKRRES